MVNLWMQKIVFQDHRRNVCEEQQRTGSEEERSDTLGHLQVATVERFVRRSEIENYNSNVQMKKPNHGKCNI